MGYCPWKLKWMSKNMVNLKTFKWFIKQKLGMSVVDLPWIHPDKENPFDAVLKYINTVLPQMFQDFFKDTTSKEQIILANNYGWIFPEKYWQVILIGKCVVTASSILNIRSLPNYFEILCCYDSLCVNILFQAEFVSLIGKSTPFILVKLLYIEKSHWKWWEVYFDTHSTFP